MVFVAVGIDGIGFEPDIFAFEHRFGMVGGGLAEALHGFAGIMGFGGVESEEAHAFFLVVHCDIYGVAVDHSGNVPEPGLGGEDGLLDWCGGELKEADYGNDCSGEASEGNPPAPTMATGFGL